MIFYEVWGEYGGSLKLSRGKNFWENLCPGRIVRNY